MSKTVNSASDERVTNNVMRHEYRVLNEREKALMKKAKDKGLEFYELLREIGDVSTIDAAFAGRLPSRELSIASTKIEEAVMWTTKHLTR